MDVIKDVVVIESSVLGMHVEFPVGHQEVEIDLFLGSSELVDIEF